MLRYDFLKLLDEYFLDFYWCALPVLLSTGCSPFIQRCNGRALVY